MKAKQGKGACPEPGCNGVLHPYYEKGEIDFGICNVCGLVIRQPMPTQEELSALYEDLYGRIKISTGETNQESNPYAVNAYAEFLRQGIVRADARVLDFGAGSGALVEKLRDQGVACDGVEPSSAAREYCAETRGFELEANLQRCGDHGYDVVTMIEVIEHLEAPWTTLVEIKRVLKPGGVLLVTTPNREAWRAKVEKGHWHQARKKFHLVLFGRADLAGQLKRAGYQRIEWIRFSPIPKRGFKYYVIGRIFQSIGMPGTLCMIARV